MTEHIELLFYFADNDCSCDADFVRLRIKEDFIRFSRLNTTLKQHAKDKMLINDIKRIMKDIALRVYHAVRIPHYTLHLHQLLQHYVKGLVTNEIKDEFIDYINKLRVDIYIKYPMWKHIKNFLATKMKSGTLGKPLQTSTLHLDS